MYLYLYLYLSITISIYPYIYLYQCRSIYIYIYINPILVTKRSSPVVGRVVGEAEDVKTNQDILV